MTTNLKLTDEQARKWYFKGDSDIKVMLEESFKDRGGKKFFEMKITDRVKSFEDACEILGEDSNKYKYLECDSKREKVSKAFNRLMIITEALNEGWEADWSDDNQYKYYPWFRYDENLQLVNNQELNKAGFSYFTYNYLITYSHFAGRLCFKTEDLAVFAGKTFIKEYNVYLG